MFHSDKNNDDSNSALDQQSTKRKPPALLRFVPAVRRQKPMLRIAPMDVEKHTAYQASVTIQKLVRGRCMQKMVWEKHFSEMLS